MNWSVTACWTTTYLISGFVILPPAFLICLLDRYQNFELLLSSVYSLNGEMTYLGLAKDLVLGHRRKLLGNYKYTIGIKCLLRIDLHSCANLFGTIFKREILTIFKTNTKWPIYSFSNRTYHVVKTELVGVEVALWELVLIRWGQTNWDSSVHWALWAYITCSPNLPQVKIN